MDTIPVGLCQCGCGQETLRSRNRSDGYEKGELRKYRRGHAPALSGKDHPSYSGKYAMPTATKYSSMSGICACGCNQPTTKAKANNYSYGILKGEYYEFKRGHGKTSAIGTTYVGSNGYIHEHQPDHPNARANGWVAQHRIVMESVLGRLLTRKEVVHHRDHNRSNNDPSNLQLIASASEHQKLHAREEKLWSNSRPELSGCRMCGTNTRRHVANGLCKRCYTNKPKTWAKHGGWICCRGCGSTKGKHEGKGLCVGCYSSLYSKR